MLAIQGCIAGDGEELIMEMPAGFRISAAADHLVSARCWADPAQMGYGRQADGPGLGR